MIDREFRREVGRRLREAREERGLTQVDLAVAIGVAPSMISHFESGKRPIALRRLLELARALNISTDRLLGKEGRPKETPMPGKVQLEGIKGEREEITPGEAVANYDLIMKEPMLALSVRRGNLSIEDMADIADIIRFVRKRDEERRGEQDEGNGGE